MTPNNPKLSELIADHLMKIAEISPVFKKARQHL